MQANLSRAFRSGVVAISALTLAGCSNLPGSSGQQGAVIGGASGAAVGAAATHNHALGAIIGGAVGAAGGYVVGANKDKIFGKDKDAAEQAARKSQENPASPEQARNAPTADINNDGFVTLDEVVAMKQAGLSDDEMIRKLRATSQVFDLNADQKRYLLDRGVSQNVIDEMGRLNQSHSSGTTAVTKPQDQVISRPSPTL